MLAEELQTRKAVDVMLRGLGVDRSLWEDFEQEAILHCWRRELARPGQSARYYLNGCRYFLRNLVRAGRSVDSPRHRICCCVALDSEQALDFVAADRGGESPVISEVAADELISTLTRRLSSLDATVVWCLRDGFSLREAARFLHISHTAANHARHRIADLALHLGFENPAPPSPKRPPAAPPQPMP